MQFLLHLDAVSNHKYYLLSYLTKSGANRIFWKDKIKTGRKMSMFKCFEHGKMSVYENITFYKYSQTLHHLKIKTTLNVPSYYLIIT